MKQKDAIPTLYTFLSYMPALIQEYHYVSKRVCRVHRNNFVMAYRRLALHISIVYLDTIVVIDAYEYIPVTL